MEFDKYKDSTYLYVLVPVIFFLITMWIYKIIFKASFADSQLKMQDKSLAIPGPMALPVLGNVHQLSPRPFIELTQMRKKYGNVIKIKLGSWNTVVLSGEDALTEAFVKNSVAFAGRAPLPSFRQIIQGNSFTFNSYSERWRVKKKILVKTLDTLGKNKNGDLERHISQSAKIFCKEMIESQQPYDPISLIKWHQTAIMLNVVFGETANTVQRKKEVDLLIQYYNEFLVIVSKFAVFDFWPWLLTIFRNATGNLKRMTDKLYQSLNELVEKEACLKSTSAHALQIIRESIPNHHKSKDDLVDNVHDIPPGELLSLSHDIIGASLDTVSNTLSWVIMYFAKYEDMQDRVRKEIEQEIGFERSPQENDMNRMPYTTACIYEICRHAAVMPLTIPHYTLTDATVCGYHIPKDTIVFGNLYSMCHDPDIWKNPDKFDPQRFLVQENGILSVDQSKVDAMHMFGSGKRKCIGRLIAKLELFIFFTTIVQKCVISEDKSQPLPFNKGLFEISHRPIPFKVNITQLNKQQS